MRKSRAVTGEAAPGAAPDAAGGGANGAPSTSPAGASASAVADGGFDGTLHILYGGEAATQVAAELAEGARGAGLRPVLTSMSDFRGVKLDRRVARCVWRAHGTRRAEWLPRRAQRAPRGAVRG